MIYAIRVLKYAKLSVGTSRSLNTGATRTQGNISSDASTPQAPHITRTSLSSGPRSTPTNLLPSTMGSQPSNITDAPLGGVLSPKMIAGSVVGAVLFVFLIGACAILYRRTMRARRQGTLIQFGQCHYFLKSRPMEIISLLN